MAFAAIICLAPLLQKLLYDRSKDWIRQIIPYKRQWMTLIMQLFSIIGDGEPFFYVMALIYSRGAIFDFSYLCCCFLFSIFWISTLKSGLHHSRPQFDDASLADENYGSCAGEFGNPSGHSLIGTSFCLTIVLYY